ncbi:MAG: flavin reductase family protein [Nannocystaceae bacterium]
MAVTSDAFKLALGQFASGVTVVTAAQADVRFGLTVSAFCSVSADPPQVLVCIANKSPARDVIAQQRHYAVNILSHEQADLGARFAGMMPRVTDRFAGVGTHDGVHGCPLLDHALATLECAVTQEVAGGAHTIFIGRVLTCETGEGAPLLYHARDWRQLAEAPVSVN